MGELELIEIIKECDGVKIAREFDNYVNSLNYKPENFVFGLKRSDYKSKYEFTLLSLGWLSELEYLYANNIYDERNKYSVELGYDLNQEICEMYDIDNIEYVKEFTFEMSMVHRTLMQSFSSMVFLWLKEIINTELEEFYVISEFINRNYDEDYYITPFI